MHVSIIFNEHFSGPLSDAVWMIDTPANRLRFNDCTTLSPNSAMFNADRYETLQAALLYAIWHVEDHFPGLTRISVTGITPDPSTITALEEDYTLEGHNDGFICLPKAESASQAP